jgi:hypothetical protein
VHQGLLRLAAARATGRLGPEVTLAQARAARDEARKKVQAGLDPAEERRDAKLALLTAQENSFETVARAWHRVWAVGCGQACPVR